ncbi:hypothetical protein PRZ48_009450 [Zasmidium cellare]|uniref:Restriction of telomere capping protein 4 n=1 Tax=Zasmidium cellare TaxID=395010 RepID=A0ABR0EBQ9_ZASCE|nr:hypothetical protein PRZ48_009450 [Zasmidium cellare]
MPQLRRYGPRLLHTVRGKAHASSDDHEEDDAPHAIFTSATKRRKATRNEARAEVQTEAESSMPTPPASNSTASSQHKPEVIDLENEEDDESWIAADPIDSDDEVFAAKSAAPPRFSGFKTLDSEPLEGCGKKKEEGFRFPMEEDKEEKRESPGSGEKRKSEVFDEDLEPEWVSSGASKKQKKAGRQTNIHVVAPRPSQKYGKGSQKDRERLEKDKKKSQKSNESPKKEDKGFRFMDIGHGPDSGSNGQPFTTAGAADGDSGFARLSSPSLSSARTTPDPDEVQVLDLPDATPYKPMVDCSYCGQPIDKFILEEFEDRYQTGGNLSFKWKRRFCRFHKEQEAKDLWRERSYPTIEWMGLARRMRKHNAFLVDILNDHQPSHYRQSLKDKVKPGTKGIRQAYRAAMDVKDGEAKPGASVGYYGPKGEKIMTDHIMDSLSDDIRKQTKRDKLIASSGVQGGVSGFVQAVLVPHLAEQLIKEDMKLTGDWSSQARQIIADSCEVGEILHPEVEEAVLEIASDSD